MHEVLPFSLVDLVFRAFHSHRLCPVKINKSSTSCPLMAGSTVWMKQLFFSIFIYSRQARYLHFVLDAPHYPSLLYFLVRPLIMYKWIKNIIQSKKYYLKAARSSSCSTAWKCKGSLNHIPSIRASISLSIHPCIHSEFIRQCIPLFICPPPCSSIHSSLPSSIYSWVHLLINPFIYSFIYPFIRK